MMECKSDLCTAILVNQQTRNIDPMLFQCWPTVCDAVPTLKQPWVNVSCLLGRMACRPANGAGFCRGTPVSSIIVKCGAQVTEALRAVPDRSVGTIPPHNAGSMLG